MQGGTLLIIPDHIASTSTLFLDPGRGGKGGEEGRGRGRMQQSPDYFAAVAKCVARC